MGVQPAKYDLEIDQAATFRKHLTWMDDEEKPIDLTGFSALMQVRRNLGREMIVELSTDNGRIRLGGVEGTITLRLDAEKTAELIPGTYVYDLLLISAGGINYRLLEGKVIVREAVSIP